MHATLLGSGTLIALTLAACASHPQASSPADAQAAFLQKLSSLCGQSFAGEIVADSPPPAANDPFTGKSLVMHVRGCSANELRIPFHVGEDRSRTWVLTRTQQGLRLKHDHRHADGSPDRLTLYGGDSADAGSAERQRFAVDEETRRLFIAEKREVSLSNVWALEITEQAFHYELSRPDRLFRVRFDLSKPVTTPPPPWGADQEDAPSSKH